MQIQEPGGHPGAPRIAVWDLGFRPFFLLASAFAALSISIWALQYAGWLDKPYLSGPMWHAHEMLFGFVLAVMVGFLLDRGSQLVEPADPDRRSAGRARGPVGRRPRSRADAVRRCGRGRQYRLSTGGSHRARGAVGRRRQPTQLFPGWSADPARGGCGDRPPQPARMSCSCPGSSASRSGSMSCCS